MAKAELAPSPKKPPETTISFREELEGRMNRLLRLRVKMEELNRMIGAGDELRTQRIGEFSGLDPRLINNFHLIDFKDVVAMTDRAIFSTFIDIRELEDPALSERITQSFKHLRGLLNDQAVNEVLPTPISLPPER